MRFLTNFFAPACGRLAPCVLAGVVAASLHLGAAAVAPAASPPVAVTACGQVIDGDAELTGDLDCSTQPPGTAVALRRRGSVSLNGFTITGNSGVIGVACESCRIIGPGEITSAWIGAIGNHLRLFGVELSGNEYGALGRRLSARDSRISGNLENGLESGGGVDGIDRARYGRMRVRDCVVENNGGSGIRARRNVKVRSSTVRGNGYSGVSGRSVIIRDSLSQDNGEHGVRGTKRVHAVRSTVTGNATHPSCDVDLFCFDLSASKGIRVQDTVCGTSGNWSDGSTWGVCADD